MRLLAIDTALEACSVAISDGGRPPVLLSEVIGRGHAERLVGMVADAMAQAGIGFADLDRIAVTVGPGSFTGIRVGIAAARAFALVTGCPVVGIGTLAIHAESARAMARAKPVLALIDARNHEVFGQLFGADGRPGSEPEVAPAARFAELATPDTLLAGSAAPLVADALGIVDERIVHRRSAPDISALLRLGLAAPEPVAPPRPLYLRPPDAKPQVGAAVARR